MLKNEGMNQASCVIDSGGLEKIFGFDKIKIQKNSWQHHMINNEKNGNF